LKPIAKIVSYADAAHEPEWFTTAPSKAVPLALKKAGLETSDVDFWELNQAFSVVGLANTKILGLNPEKVDVNGGAVALGHPLGATGAFLVTKALNELERTGGRYGLISMCCGGGLGTGTLIERI
jgi:acetyl-CoA C-acetyltransferase